MIAAFLFGLISRDIWHHAGRGCTCAQLGWRPVTMRLLGSTSRIGLWRSHRPPFRQRCGSRSRRTVPNAKKLIMWLVNRPSHGVSQSRKCKPCCATPPSGMEFLGSLPFGQLLRFEICASQALWVA